MNLIQWMVASFCTTRNPKKKWTGYEWITLRGKNEIKDNNIVFKF
jgi:hypothetical protein